MLKILPLVYLIIGIYFFLIGVTDPHGRTVEEIYIMFLGLVTVLSASYFLLSCKRTARIVMIITVLINTFVWGFIGANGIIGGMAETDTMISKYYKPQHRLEQSIEFVLFILIAAFGLLSLLYLLRKDSEE